MIQCMICKVEYENNELLAGVCADCHDDADSYDDLLQNVLDKQQSLATEVDMSRQQSEEG